MLRFREWPEKWWNKRLVAHDGRPLPAELAVLAIELRPGESGAWLNSSKAATGVVDLVPDTGDGEKSYRTIRETLPEFVSRTVKSVYEKSSLGKGCPDLVIWHATSERVRFVEVKCPHWDRPTPEQELFIEAARASHIECEIAEWEFELETNEGPIAAEPVGNPSGRPPGRSLRTDHRPDDPEHLGRDMRRILEALSEGPLSVSETRAKTGLSNHDFAKARAVLRGASLIDSHRESASHTHFLKLSKR